MKNSLIIGFIFIFSVSSLKTQSNGGIFWRTTGQKVGCTAEHSASIVSGKAVGEVSAIVKGVIENLADYDLKGIYGDRNVYSVRFTAPGTEAECVSDWLGNCIPFFQDCTMSQATIDHMYDQLGIKGLSPSGDTGGSAAGTEDGKLNPDVHYH